MKTLLTMVLVFTGNSTPLTARHIACGYWTPSKAIVLVIVDGSTCPKELVLK